MKWILVCGLAMSGALSAEVEKVEGKGDDKSVTPAVAEKFDASTVIAGPIAKLEDPKFVTEVGAPEMLVFTTNEKARRHVQQGFSWIHGSWDFEAYRHFCAALKEDDQCLMAYCGVVLSLTHPKHEFKNERARAYNRMLTLAEYKVDGEYYYPENERIYALAIAELIANGVSNSARVFTSLARRYPNDLQAELFAVYLSRGGYNAMGRARMAQRQAVERFETMVSEHPDDPIVLNFLLLSEAEAPCQAVDFKGDLLPRAQRLVELSSGKVAPWLSLQGFVALRSGDAELAVSSYLKAISLYEKWQAEDGVGIADNEGLLRAQLCLATVYVQVGSYEKAAALVKQVADYKMPSDRARSVAAKTQKWGRLLACKIEMERGNYAKARKVLPKPLTTNLKKMDPHSMVIICYQQLCQAMELAEKGKMNQARKMHLKLVKLIAMLKEMPATVVQTGDFAEYLRAVSAIAVLHYELTAMISDQDGLATNWYRAAIEGQRQPPRLLPMNILYPMEFKLGQLFEKLGEKEKAVELYKNALQRSPCYSKVQAALKKLGAVE